MVKNNVKEYNKVPITEKDIDNKPPKYGYGVRHIQIALFFLSLTSILISRGHLGVTIIAMTSNSKGDIAALNTTHNENDIAANINDTFKHNLTAKVETEILTHATKSYKTFNWSESVQEMILYAFNLGYLILMFPMGIVSQVYGSKLPLQIALFGTGIVSLITPKMTEWGGWKAICCCCIVQGLCQTGTLPCIQGLLGKWVPDDEKATLSSYVYTGIFIGSMISFQLGGYLGVSDWGWPSTFYIVGVINILCFLLLTKWGKATPSEHESITDEEKNYIMGAVSNNMVKQKIKTPWREIFTSKPLWGTVITHVGNIVMYVLLYNQGPTYLHYTLGIDVKNSGLLSSLPYIASCFTSILFGWLSDYSTNKKILSKINARRIFNSIGCYGMAICLILMSYTTNYVLVILCFVTAMAVSMSTNAGWMINYIDLAPNFSGTLTSIGSTLTGACVLCIPVIVSYVVTDMTNIKQWRIVFYIIAAINFITNGIFILLVSSDIQPWNNGTRNDSSFEEVKDDMHTTSELKEKN